MRHGDHLYRRPSGYYIRVIVPASLRPTVGKREIHRSLRTNDYGTARLRALTALHDIKIYFAELHHMDLLKLTIPSPLLSGTGELTLPVVADSIGLTHEELVAELIRHKPPLVVHLNRVPCYVLDVSDVEALRDAGAIEGGGFVMNEIERRFELTTFTGYAGPVDDRRGILAAALDKPILSATLHAHGGKTIVLSESIQLSFDRLRIGRKAADGLRRTLLAAVKPEIVEAVRAAPQISQPTAANLHAAAKPIRLSEFRAQWLEAKKTKKQRLATLDKDGRETEPFLELIGDPYLHEITDEMIDQYRNQLRRLPDGLQALRRGEPPPSLTELAALADKDGLPRISESRVEAYVTKLGKVLRYGVGKRKINYNPHSASTIAAAGASTDNASKKSDREKRAPFSEKELTDIFGAEWFVDGVGKKTVKNTYLYYQPNYYWVPLLLAYSGARCNEVCQLLVSDIRQSPAGIWYLDFNLDGPEKVDVQEDSEIKFDGKAFKTVNSLRVVPIHDHLIRLGLVDYVQVLKGKGHIYLFPDLRFDPMKGRGKCFGQWFNERYLGRRLKIERDSTKTAYSFRHTFATRLGHVHPNAESIQAEILGHKRGETESKNLYDKGRGAEGLAPYLNALVLPELQHIAPFKVEEGMAALGDALHRKDGQRKRRAEQPG